MFEINESSETQEMTGLEIAVIGMAGRFPGAKDIDQFWKNLKYGVESITFFSEQELKDAGVTPEKLTNPNYIKAKAIIDDEDIELFDATFFGYTPLEAEIMDPQMRLFHEIAWEALEDAGYEPDCYKGLIGLYAGASYNHYWEALCMLSGKGAEMGTWASVQFMDKDFFTLRISYALNLRGPSFSMYTACSTSLVAIHLACQALLNGECDMALAGGITVWLPNKTGYTYAEGMIMSPDGHCRAFDASARGTVNGNGGGIVLLKLLENADADKDNIYAIVKGTAINNDGTRKGGFTAPSVEGQLEVIQTALQTAQVEPGSISYIEAHGTGTPLGDPIEMEALKEAFKSDKKRVCAVGALKSNIGHLDAAAGVAGFIKTTLALKYRLIPPSLHFKTPNPEIDFENSPFYINTQLKEWRPAAGTGPLRAGVSSFGIGGTNAHIILEEYARLPLPGPSPSNRETKEKQYKLLLLSAATPSALDRMAKNLAGYLKNNSVNPDNPPHLNHAHNNFSLADTAYTLQVGRRMFKHRLMLVCTDAQEAVNLLTSASSPAQGKVRTLAVGENRRPIVFMFSGLGSQYVDMGRELYEKENLFRSTMDHCFKILESLTGDNIKKILYPREENEADKETTLIHRPEIAPVTVFIFEYALATLLMKWGVSPRAMIGYSFGEYTTACLAGVFSLEEALKLVVSRGQLISELPDGAMLSVPLPANELSSWLDNHKDLAIAIDNGPSCVVAGPTSAIDAFEEQLKEKRYIPMRVVGARAIHSPMMSSISGKFKENFNRLTLKNPKIPYISNVTGTWITTGEAADPNYWVTHLTQTVRFADGIKCLLKELPGCVLIEIGPGRDISTLTQRHIETQVESSGNSSSGGKESKYTVLNLVRHPQQQVSDIYFLLNRIGRLWLCGQTIDWSSFYAGEKRRRISLPTYPFEGQRYRIDREAFDRGKNGLDPRARLYKRNDIADWFYVPSWKRVNLAANPTNQPGKIAASSWLVFMDSYGLAEGLIKELETIGGNVIIVESGSSFLEKNERHFIINPQQESDYNSLFYILGQQGKIPGRVLYCWGITGVTTGKEDSIFFQEPGFYNLLHIARSIGKQRTQDEIQVTVITNNMQEVVGKDGRNPGKTLLLGPVKIIPLEYANIKCRSIDLDMEIPLYKNAGDVRNYSYDNGKHTNLVRQLLAELISGSSEPVVAYRSSYRWVQFYEPAPPVENQGKSMLLRQSGVYLITGGLGGIGGILTEFLARNACIRLILTGRTGLPDSSLWESLLIDPGCDYRVKAKIQKIKELEKLGAEVMVFNADVTQQEQMEIVIAQAEKKFGPINGVIHCAGLPDGELIQGRTQESLEQVLAPKVKGTQVLEILLKNRTLDFFILCSSISSILPTLGQVGYYSANAFLDAFAHYKRIFENYPIVSINWDRWRQVGIAVIAENRHKTLTGKDLEGGITREEGEVIFRRILSDPLTPLPQVAISTRDLQALFTQAHSFKAASFLADAGKVATPALVMQRPDLDNDYVAPVTGTEEKLTLLWAKFFGIQKVGITDDFIELGGDSLKALMLLPKIYKEFEVNVPIAQFFANPTIQKLAAYIDNVDKRAYLPLEPTEKKEYYNLSPAQKRLFVHQQVTPESTAYNEFTAVVLGANHPVTNLENIFKKLIQRHESLRTSLHMIGEEPVQRVHDKVAFEIEYYDTSQEELKAGSKRDMKTQTAEKDKNPYSSVINHFVRPLDLSRPPLMQVGLLKMTEGRHILLIDIHHLIADGRSFQVLMEELAALYEGKELPELYIQYKDFSEWQRKYFQKQQVIINRQEEYWLRNFKGRVPLLELPTDYSRPKIQSFEGSQLSFELDSARAKKLKEIAVKDDLTLFMILLGIFSIFLSKLSGQEDIVIGSPILGRNHPQVQSTIGMFVNTLALRTFPNGTKTLHLFLKELKAKIIEALENQDYPFDELVEKLGIPRDVSRNPIFNVTFAMLNTRIGTGGQTPKVQEQSTKPQDSKKITIEQRMSKFDLGLEATENNNKILLTFLYCTKLFKKETVARFVIYLNEIINAVCENSNKQIKDIFISHGLLELDSTLPETDFKF